ncbi:MAG: type secretion system protein [Chthonomonadaceae bacterium]|nr:type secretion system protein [Chthonomonadaceae bacterium]
MSLSLSGTQSNRGGLGLWRLRVVFGDTIPKQALGRFFDNLATLVATGMSIPEAVQRAAQSTDGEWESICAAILGQVAAGVPLSRALARWKNRLPEIVLPILEVGELSGTLETSSRRLAYAFQQGAAIDRRIRCSVFDPKLIIAVLVLDTVSHGFAPSLPQMLQQGLESLFHLTLLYLVGRLIVRIAFRWQPLHLAVDTLKLVLPSIGGTLRNLAAARWARSFATLWNCGIPISTALEVSSRSALNERYAHALRRAALQTRQGISLRDSLSSTQLLPNYLLDVIGTGEMSGNLGASLDHFASLLEEEAFARATQQFVSLLLAGQILGALLMLRAAFP